MRRFAIALIIFAVLQSVAYAGTGDFERWFPEGIEPIESSWQNSYNLNIWSWNQRSDSTLTGEGLTLKIKQPLKAPLYCQQNGMNAVQISLKFSTFNRDNFTSQIVLPKGAISIPTEWYASATSVEYGIKSGAFKCLMVTRYDEGIISSPPSYNHHKLDGGGGWVSLENGINTSTINSLFLQADSRWADMNIGWTGYKMRHYGGELAAAAMMAWYNCGQYEWDPIVVNNKLKECPDGFVGSKGIGINWNRLARLCGGHIYSESIDTALAREKVIAVQYRRDITPEWGVVHQWYYDEQGFAHQLWDPKGRVMCDREYDGASRVIFMVSQPTEQWKATDIYEGKMDPPSYYWGGFDISGITCYSIQPGYAIDLLKGNTTISRDTKLEYNDPDTGALIEDHCTMNNNLPGGRYTLRVTGAPNTTTQIKLFEYGAGIGTSMDKTTTASVMLDSTGVGTYTFDHLTKYTPKNLDDIVGLPTGTPVVLPSTVNVIALLEHPTWNKYVYSIQDATSLLPKKLVTASALTEFTPATVYSGATWDGNAISTSYIYSSTGALTCKPIYRTNIANDRAAGGIYTKSVVKIKSAPGSGAATTADNVTLVKAGFDFSPFVGKQVIITGASGMGGFRVSSIMEAK